MDVTAYIESGILELYATGALTPAEAREVEALAAQYPEIKARIRQIQDTLDAFAQTYAREPRAGLKEEFLASLEKEKFPWLKKITRLAPLAWGLALAGLFLAAFLYFRCQQMEDQIEQLKQDQFQLRNSSQKAIAEIAFLTNPHTLPVTLKGLDVAPEAEVTVYWNPLRGATYLSIESLPPPPPGKQYQLWSIDNGLPSDAGLLIHAVADLQPMKEVKKAQTFAITLEKEGGSPTPTLDQMVAIGNI